MIYQEKSKDKNNKIQAESNNKVPTNEEDAFEKTAQELEEVLKHKLSYTEPLKSPILMYSPANSTIKGQSTVKKQIPIKTDPGKFILEYLNFLLIFILPTDCFVNRIHIIYLFFDTSLEPVLNPISATNGVANQNRLNNLTQEQSRDIPILKKEGQIGIQMDILEEKFEKKPEICPSPLIANAKKNQTILDIKMDAAKLHHQHIMLNLIRSTPVTAKNFYKVRIQLNSISDFSIGHLSITNIPLYDDNYFRNSMKG